MCENTFINYNKHVYQQFSSTSLFSSHQVLYPIWVSVYQSSEDRVKTLFSHLKFLLIQLVGLLKQRNLGWSVCCDAQMLLGALDVCCRSQVFGMVQILQLRVCFLGFRGCSLPSSPLRCCSCWLIASSSSLDEVLVQHLTSQGSSMINVWSYHRRWSWSTLDPRHPRGLYLVIQTQNWYHHHYHWWDCAEWSSISLNTRLWPQNDYDWVSWAHWSSPTPC